MLYVDAANAGVSGDMFIAALIDLGAEVEAINRALDPISDVIGEFEIKTGMVRRGVYASTSYRFNFKDRKISYSKCKEAIEKARLTNPARGFALSCFETLTDAESNVHGVEKGKLQLHDAPDTISDFVAAAALLDNLSLLGSKALSSPINTGKGFFTFHKQHSTLPAPATTEILKGKPIFGDVDMELTTPTGASILVNLSDEFVEEFPLMRVKKIGYGAGYKDMDFPNVLKLYMGEEGGSGLKKEDIVLLETNVDTATGEALGYLFERLFEEGALDVAVVSCVMKKNRPGHIVKVMCRREDAESLTRTIIEETGTLGVRIMPEAHRLVLNRKVLERKVKIKGREFKVRFKAASDDNGIIITEKPEFEDMRRIAKETGLSLRKVEQMLEKLKD
jgi:uncharacterized protein (TIGR00299 family) protein